MARGRRVPALRTRLHGLRHMCSRRAALPRRALWVLAFCTALGLLLSWSSNRLLHWLSFPSHTQVRTEWSRQLAFPAVTLCNNNPLRFPRLSKGDLYYAGHWLGLLLPNRTARPLLTELLRGDEARLRWFAKLADFRLFLPPRHYEGISADFMDRLGHQLEDMLLSCKYRGELCGPHNFSAVSAPRDPPIPPDPIPARPGRCPGSASSTCASLSHGFRVSSALCVFFPRCVSFPHSSCMFLPHGLHVFPPLSACFPHGVCVFFPYFARRGCAVSEGGGVEVTNRHRLRALQQCGTRAVNGVGGTAVLSAEVQRFKHQMAAVATKFPLRSTQFSPRQITTVSLNASLSPPEQS